MTKTFRVEIDSPGYRRLITKAHLLSCQMDRDTFNSTVAWIESSVNEPWYAALHLTKYEMMARFGVTDENPTGSATFYIRDPDTALALRLMLNRCFFRGPISKNP